MAGTLTPDPEFQKYNAAKEKAGQYFRFKPRSVAFNVLFMGVIPAALTYLAYADEGQTSVARVFRNKPVFDQEYVPRKKDL